MRPPIGCSPTCSTSTKWSAVYLARSGRGVMEDVSRRIINEMAACIKANVEGGEQHQAAVSGGSVSADTPAPAPVTAQPVNAVPMFFQVLWAGIRRLFGARSS